MKTATEGYIGIGLKLSCARMLLVLLSATLTIAGAWLLLEVWNFLEFRVISRQVPQKYLMAQITFVPWCIAQYFLITLFIISLCALHKKGYNNMKPIKEDGIKKWVFIVIQLLESCQD